MYEIKHSMRKYLTRKEEKEAQEAFKIFDQDGSGSISIRVRID
jgi:Ca2+-binding EF-hand superfamily protein